MQWYIWVIIGVLAVSILAGIPIMLKITIPIAHYVCDSQFSRPEKPEYGWTRNICSFPDNEENMEMHRRGMAWAEENKAAINEVSIENEGLKLCGQYFDFGFDKAVIILPGRAEPCTYSYYFAMPYKNYGYNVLVIDNRATGLSEGKHTYAGMKEYKDVQKWIGLLNEKFGNRKVILHGICMGSASGLRAATHEGAPDCIEAVIADGMFTTFYATLRTHFIDLGKPLFPVLYEASCMLSRRIGENIATNGPVKDIRKYNGPLLMIHGKQDRFSTPPKAKKLFSLCPSQHKKLVWFDEGMHSHLKIRAQEKYDEVVGEFIAELNQKQG